MKNLNLLVGERFFTDGKKETELREIEDKLMEIYGCFVKCGYDCIYSHKYKEEKRENADYIINYELYETEEDMKENEGGFDGEVHELFYLKGNEKYIVITETEF